MSKQIKNLRVYLPVMTKFPDPANIQNTGQWYVLGHVSSGLAHYDHIAGKFVPLLADFESYSSGVHTFKLKDDARFSDGTRITSHDVVASIKRLLIRKTSTHFPLWEYLVGCSDIKHLDDDCPGITAVTDQQIEIRLGHPVETFLLQMSSPETGIWFQGDINPETLEIKPTKYSGPYSIEGINDSDFRLKRNPLNPLSIEFPESPLAIEIKALKADQALPALVSNQIDALVRSHNPYEATGIDITKLHIFSSAPATLIYFHGAGTKKRKAVPRKFLEQLWKNNTDKGIVPADNFLPFDPKLSLSSEEFLNELPSEVATQSKAIRLGVPWTYLSRQFYAFLEASAKQVGFGLEIVELTRDEWLEASDKGTAVKDIDFVLGLYAASERYPAVQLRYITGDRRGPDIDLKRAETPELDTEKQEILRDYQKALVRDQYAVPLFFSRHQITYNDSVDVGDQPPVDAEVELWRFVKK